LCDQAGPEARTDGLGGVRVDGPAGDAAAAEAVPLGHVVVVDRVLALLGGVAGLDLVTGQALDAHERESSGPLSAWSIARQSLAVSFGEAGLSGWANAG